MRHTKYCLAALVLGLASSARAQDLASAHGFVAGLYGAYHGSGPDYLGRQAKATFSPPLLSLLRRATAPKDEVGALDGDPICDCQDFRISKVDVQIAAGSSGKAVATARFRNFGEPQKVTLDLVALDGHWRVSDVHTTNTPSLVAYLRQSLRGHH